MPQPPIQSSADGDARPPAGRPLRKRIWFRALVFLSALYVAWCATLWFYQDKLLFPADLAADPMPMRYSAATVELIRDIAGGRVVAWFIPGFDVGAAAAQPLVIFFHGNAEIIDHQQDVIEGYRRMGCSLLLPEYRGYGRSDGTPSEAAIVGDALYFYDAVCDRSDIDKTRIVIHGRSLGGGPAAQLAARRKPRVLILESTFKSAASMAHRYLAPTFLSSNPFRTDRVLAALNVPALIFHGKSDDIIPVAHGRALRSIARDAIYVEYDCRHNDFPGDANLEHYWGEIRRFLIQHDIIHDKLP
jgi:hypothetical protein